MMKHLMKIILFAVFIVYPVFSQEILKKQLTNETFPEWDSYIKQFAPSDSALKVVLTLANRHFLTGRAAVAREIYMMYRPYFATKDNYFDLNIRQCEDYLISQTPTPDIYYVYENFIKQNAPAENAFVAVQRIADNYINRRDWDSSIIIFNKFKPLFPNFTKRFDKIIEVLEADTENLVIRNFGPLVNTSAAEWDPNPTPDGKYLYFSANSRPGGYGKDDVWLSRFEKGQWQKPVNVGPKVNGPNDETIDNITADGNDIMLSGTFEGTFGEFDIYHVQRTQNGWGALEHYPYPINTRWVDEGANLTSNGKAILFTSDRPGGIGEYHPFTSLFHGSQWGNIDIYVCVRTDSGWSEPINLGPMINTPYAERSPYLHPDGKTLYFSSDGHPGLGRLDVFKAVRLRDDSWTEWSEPVNLGKEINTILDDWGYKVSVSGDSAVFAARNRSIGYGDQDIYSVTLPKISRPERVVTIRGKVTDSKGNPLSVEIKWEDLATGKNAGSLRSNPEDGSYIIVLPLGKKYGFYAEKGGFYPTAKNIDLKNAKENSLVNEDIVLTSIKEMKEEKAKVRINNIFFDFDDYTLLPESFPELDRLVNLLQSNSELEVEIDGHTDIIGKGQYNIDLSTKRAEIVRDYLVSKGLDKKRFTVKGFGNTKPVADNETEEGMAKNRRVEIWFVR